jgi:hypothetical protein
MADRARLPIPPFATPVEAGADDIPTAAPFTAAGVSHFPELAARPPTNNESHLLSGQPIAMASSNVMEIRFDGSPAHSPPGTGRLFVRFLSGHEGRYDAVPLAVAVAFVETDSPGRFVWNKLRDVYHYTPLRGGDGTRRPPQVVRLHNR